MCNVNRLRVSFVVLFSLLFAACGGGGGGGGGASVTNLTYTVTYDGNGHTGGSAPTDSNRYEQGQIVTVLGNTGNLVRTGFTFAGWNTQANGAGTTYTPAQTFSIGAANVTLYARWTANPTYTVTYDGNGHTGGSVPVDSNHYEQGQIVTVLGNIGNLVRTGYTFTGWNTQADGNGLTYTPAQTFSIGAANVTLYARWTANPTYTVTYDGNGHTGGSVPVDSNHYEQGQIVTVPGNTGNLVRAGFTFAGWNTQANGGGTTYTPAQTFTMGGAAITLFAKWEIPVCVPSAETCDGIDNDCDGVVDNGFNVGAACNQGICATVTDAAVVCWIDGSARCYSPSNPDVGANEICDGIDNDCDGVVDEDFILKGSSCDDPGPGLCSNGIYVCSADQLGLACLGDTAEYEVCDGQDNDCNGQADETFDLNTDSSNCGVCGNSVDDGNVCTVDACVSGAPVNSPVADGTACGTGLVCQGGACVAL